MRDRRRWFCQMSARDSELCFALAGYVITGVFAARQVWVGEQAQDIDGDERYENSADAKMVADDFE